MVCKNTKSLGEIPPVDASGSAVECKHLLNEEFKKLTQNEEFEKLTQIEEFEKLTTDDELIQLNDHDRFRKLPRQPVLLRNDRPPKLGDIVFLSGVNGFDTVELPCPPTELRNGWEPTWFTKPTLRTQAWIDANECQLNHDHRICHEHFPKMLGIQNFLM